MTVCAVAGQHAPVWLFYVTTGKICHNPKNGTTSSPITTRMAMDYIDASEFIAKSQEQPPCRVHLAKQTRLHIK